MLVPVALAAVVLSAQATIRASGLNFGAPTVSAKGNVVEPKLGDIIYAADEQNFMGYANVGVGKDWVPLAASANQGNPPGTVITFAGATCPTGYVAADGKSYSQTARTALFANVGAVNGDGSTGVSGDVGCPSVSGCFNVPDYRGRFLRGAAAGQTTDPDRGSRVAMAAGGASGDNVGSVQVDAFASHTHAQRMSGGSGTFTGYYLLSGQAWTGVGPHQTGEAGGSIETRPKNAYVNFCVKVD